MKIVLILIPALCALMATTAHAAGLRKPCEELRAEIAAKIEAKGIKSYRIDIIDAAATSDLRTIGTCNGSSQRLVYQKLAETPAIAVVASH